MSYNRRDVLLSKLAGATAELQDAVDLLEAAKRRVSRAHQVEDTIRQQLESLKLVQVAYLTTPIGNPIDTPLTGRPTFDYIDGTTAGLIAGNIVVAPTHYNRYQRAIVVSVGGQRTYSGKLNKIVEVLYR